MRGGAGEAAEAGIRQDETRLIERAKRRDQAALRLLIDRHKDRLFAFLWRMVRNHHDAEELCQEAFLKAFAALDSFDSNYRFSTWLFTIGYRLALNAGRRKRPISAEVDFAGLADPEESVDERAANSEEALRLRSAVWNAVDQLNPQQRATVLLFYKQQQSCQDIARVMDTPVATVKSHLHRARARLRTLLEPMVADDIDGGRILDQSAG